MKIVNKTGYLKGAKTAKNPVNIIPSNLITTQGMAFPIKANGKTLYPNTGQYKFPTPNVVETPLKQKGTKSTKANPIPTPSLGPAFTNPPAKSNNLALTSLQNALVSNQTSPNVEYTKQLEAYKKYTRDVLNREPYTLASGRADPTIGPIDAAIAGVAGLPGATLRLAGGALNSTLGATIPGVPLTVGQGLSAYGGYDALANRAPRIIKNVKNNDYKGALQNLGIGVLGLYGLKGTGITDLKKLQDLSKVITNNPAIKVGRDLRKIKAQGLTEGLSEYEIARKQLDKVGITSSQRKAYIPGVSDVLSEYVYPFGYGGVNENKLLQTFNNVLKKTPNSKLDIVMDNPLGRSRLDAWRMYLGKPQKNNTFRMAETAPVNHSSYTPKQLKDMNIMSVNYEHRLIPGIREVDPLLKPITLSRDNAVMGGYNRRLSSDGLEYNDIWDLEPTIKTTSFLPDKLISKMENNKFFDKLLYSKSNKNILSPREIKIPMHKLGVGKPFMTHGNIPGYTWQSHKQAVGNAIDKRIKREIDLLSRFGENTSEFKQISNRLEQELIYKDALDNLPEIKKNGAKTLKYKKGSKGVSLAFSRGEKDPKGGLTQKGVDKYNRATGGNLKMAVTTPPSKLKAGSKAANRRKSFCARMSGVKGPMRKPNGEPSRKALALRKWNC
jgi:hypothetical protein